MSAQDTIKQIQDGVHIASTDAILAAPIVGVFNPGIGAAMTLLTPIAENFVVGTLGLVVTFKQDMTPAQMVEALQASKSAMWPTPPPIEAVPDTSAQTKPIFSP